MNPINSQVGYNRGNVLFQSSGNIGGFRNVFVKLQGNKNELVYPTFGAKIQNAFKQVPAQMFAGDLCEIRYDEKGLHPQLFMLKTYQVVSADTSKKTVSIYKKKHSENRCYRHLPCVGDFLMIAPAVIGGAGTAATVVSVAEATETYNDEQVDVWVVTLSAALAGAAKDNILVEGVADGSTNMLVKNINSVLDSDLTFVVAPSAGAENFKDARYNYTPALGGLMYRHKMSPIPACVEKYNTSHVNGWVKIDYYGVPDVIDTRIVALEGKGA